MVDLRDLRIGTPDLQSAVEFATKIVGLQLAGREGKAAYFRSDKTSVRGDTRDHTLVYIEGDPSDHVIGFDLKNREDFDKAGAANAIFPHATPESRTSATSGCAPRTLRATKRSGRGC